MSHINHRHKEGFGYQHKRKRDIQEKVKNVFQKQIYYFRMSVYFKMMLMLTLEVVVGLSLQGCEQL